VLKGLVGGHAGVDQLDIEVESGGAHPAVQLALEKERDRLVIGEAGVGRMDVAALNSDAVKR
jgi:hypothetical protein